MANKDNSIEFDFSEEIAAKTMTTCDSCGKEIGARYASAYGSIEIPLRDGEHKDGYPKYKEYHLCGEECLLKLLQGRSSSSDE